MSEGFEGVLYRVNGGDPIAAEDMTWGLIYPWDRVEVKRRGSPWSPTLSEPPVLLKESPQHTPGPDGRYHLKEPVWPPRR